MFETGGKLISSMGNGEPSIPHFWSNIFSFYSNPFLAGNSVHHLSVLKTSVHLYIGWLAQTHFETVDILNLWDSISECIKALARTQIGIFASFLLTCGMERKIKMLRD